MRKKSTNGSIFRTGVSAVALCAVAWATPSFAQQADEPAATEDDETLVIVTGIRKSLQTAQDIKRNADTFVDSITASDIGALPDRSVVEALQRVPGVAITRFAAGNDPNHFSVEGSGAIIRGLPMVRAEFNGRDTFSANNGRALNFEDVPPELMQGVDVYKNQTADLIEGGIAGSVNLRTRVPFDSNGRVFALSAEASYGDLAEELTPGISMLYSDRWTTGFGEVGLLLNASYGLLRTTADGTQIQPHYQRTDLYVAGMETDCETEAGDPCVFVPNGANFRRQEFERRRNGYAAAVQWSSPDDKWLATGQFVRSDSSIEWIERHSSVEHDPSLFNTVVPPTGQSWLYDNGGRFMAGTMVSNEGWRAYDPRVNPAQQTFEFQGGGGEYGVRRGNYTQLNSTDRITDDYSFNLKWAPTDRLRFNFDAQYVDSQTQNLDFTIGLWGFAGANYDFRGDELKIKLSNAGPGSFGITDRANWYWGSAMDHIEDSEGTEKAYRADVEYDLDAGWLESVRAGVRYSDRDQTTRWSEYNWGSISQLWGCCGDTPNAWPNEQGSSASWADRYLTGFTEVYNYPNWYGGDLPNPVPGGLLHVAPSVVRNYGGVKQSITDLAERWRPFGGANTWVPLDQRTGVLPGTPFREREINETEEVTNAIYARLDFGNGNEVFGVEVDGNIGVRYIQSENSTVGFISLPLLEAPAQCATNLIFNYTSTSCHYTAEDLAFANEAAFKQTSTNEYSHTLPSFNLKLGLTDEMLIRFAWSKAISRPDMGLLRNYLQINAGDEIGLNANGQNVELLPECQALSGGPPITDPNSIPINCRIARTLLQNDLTNEAYAGEAGNPFLKPTQADQFDISFEWYFADAGYLSVAAFKKDFKDYLSRGKQFMPITNNGVTREVLVDRWVNLEDGELQGFEIGYQQFYDFLPAPLDGFGIQANYSYIDNKSVPQTSTRGTDPNAGGGTNDTLDLPLVGVSEHNYNLVGMYEKGPIEARLAYNWRSEYLLTTADSAASNLPTWADDIGQLDGSFLYKINDRLRMGVQGTNLTNSVSKTLITSAYFDGSSQQPSSDTSKRFPRSYFVNDRRITFVLRANF